MAGFVLTFFCRWATGNTYSNGAGLPSVDVRNADIRIPSPTIASIAAARHA